jgi:1,4-alpha-glucan branching enzyme
MATQVKSKKKESFTYFAPGAENVLLAGDFTDWEKHPVTLKKQKDGSWKATIPLAPGMHEYRFLVDGQWRDDQTCGARKLNAFGAQNCVREVR